MLSYCLQTGRALGFNVLTYSFASGLTWWMDTNFQPVEQSGFYSASQNESCRQLKIIVL